MKIFLTGGFGAIGARLAIALDQWDHTLVLLSRHQQQLPTTLKDATLVVGDINNSESYVDSLKGCDMVIHCAAITHTRRPVDYLAVNVEGTKKLLAACPAQLKQFIFISSRTASKAGGGYAYSKLLAEQAVQVSSLPWTILRPAEVYGIDGHDALSQLVERIKHRKIIPVIGRGDYPLAPVHVDDLVTAITASVGNPIALGKTYTIAGPESISFTQLVDQLSNLYHVKPKKVFLPISLVRLGARLLTYMAPSLIVPDQVSRLVCPKSSDIALAQQDLKFKPRSIEVGLNLD